MKRLVKHGIEWFYRSRHKLATAAVCVLLGLIGYQAVFGVNGFLVLHRKAAESQRLEREIQALEQNNEHSAQQIKALKSDPQAIEKEAREHLHYAREGEKIYPLPTATPKPENPR
jgi:cell division protein FtsB